MIEKLSKSISAGIVINILSVALIKGVNIVKAPIMTEILTTEDYGVLSIFGTWAGVIGIIAGLGVHGSLTNFRVKADDSAYHRFCWNMLLVGIIGHIVFFLLFWPAKDLLAEMMDLPNTLVPIMIVSALLSFLTTFMSAFFIIDNKAINNAGLSFIMVVGSFVLSLFLIFFREDKIDLYLPFIEGNLIVNFIISMVCIFYFWKKGGDRLRVDYIKYGLAIGGPLVFHSLAGIVLGSSDRIMIQHINNMSAAGVYSFTYNFAGILSSIWSAINAIWVPFFFRYLQANDTVSLYEKKRNFDFIYLMLSVGFLLICPEVFRLLANERYWGQMYIVPIIVIALFANHIYSFPTNYETFKEKTKHVATGTIGAAVVNIILNLLLIPIFQEMGAAIATALSYMALFVFHLFIAKMVIGDYPFKQTISPKYCAVLVGAICCFYLLFDYWGIRWIIGAVVGLFLLKDIIHRRAIL